MGLMRCSVGLLMFSQMLLPISAEASENTMRLFHHDLAVRIETACQTLEGTDNVTAGDHGAKPLSFTLHPDARIHAVTHAGRPVPYQFEKGVLEIRQSAFPHQGNPAITIQYAVVFQDTIPKDTLYSEDPTYGVAGVIASQGIFLMDAAGWYPSVPGSLATFRIQVRRPEGDGSDHRGHPQGKEG